MSGPRKFDPAVLNRRRRSQAPPGNHNHHPWPHSLWPRSANTEQQAAAPLTSRPPIQKLKYTELTAAERQSYRELLGESQAGRCAICRRAFTQVLAPHLDHCHEGGHVRGLLCRQCNFGLGYFGDSIARLENAAEYIANDIRAVSKHQGTLAEIRSRSAVS